MLRNLSLCQGLSAKGSDLADLKAGDIWAYHRKRHLSVKVLQVQGEDVKYRKIDTGEIKRCSAAGFVKVYRKL